MSGYCKKCGRYNYTAIANCNCVRYECAIPWQNAVSENDWAEVWAYDTEAAAEKYAEDCDSDGDYIIIKNGSGEVWVREGAERVITKWAIEAESVPTYSASQIECSTSQRPVEQPK